MSDLLAIYEKHSYNILKALSYMAEQLEGDIGDFGSDDHEIRAEIDDLEAARAEIEAARAAR